ncbi:MAG: DUF420 domain-containing protein [Candidatus Eisenbacteria bacterium]|uniref:DUF420 domain-containing protein n=1 Tax=Eiseniibacteriota bacterium TaxID=2212470 RepID=A0A7Y2E751_UNCEI|nr:DUF420 domain-containing protein [Candidatus Eisenbacteria bacterium]
MGIHDLPTLNATLNGLATVWLILGFTSIKAKRIERHRKFMLLACVTSILFLVSYLIYHANTGANRFQTPGAWRTLYLGILLTHTILAAVVGPMVIITLFRALRNDLARHKKLARWTWPIWMYVSVTGVVIYFMLYHLDPRLSS